MLAFLAATTRDIWSASRFYCFTCNANAPYNLWSAPEPEWTLEEKIITVPGIKAGKEAYHLFTTDRFILIRDWRINANTAGEDGC